MKKIKKILFIAIILCLSSCGYTDADSTSTNSFNKSMDVLSLDFSGTVNDLPGNNNNIYKTAEELLGVTSEPQRLVGKYNKDSLKESYEKLAEEKYILWLFENEDGTASQMYEYYFFDNLEDYKKAYDSFCMKNGSPSIKNEKSLFFGNGGSAKIYVQTAYKYQDVLVTFQAKDIEVVNSWGEQSPSEEASADVSIVSNDEDASKQ